MNELSKLSIKPSDYPTATELSLLASDLASKGIIKDPRSGLESAIALWESSYLLLSHRKKERAQFNDFLAKHSEGVPEWPDQAQVAITFSEFSRVINDKLNQKTFCLSLECLLFFIEFCRPWSLQEVFYSEGMPLNLDKRKGCVKYADFEKLVLKNNIPQELHAIYATYLFIEAQKSGTDTLTVDLATISPETFTLSNLKPVQDAVKAMEVNGVYNDDYELLSVQIYHLSRFYSEVQKYLSNSKKSRSRQK